MSASELDILSILWTAINNRLLGDSVASTVASASRAALAARPPPEVAAAFFAREETPKALAAAVASPRPEAPVAPPSATKTPPQAEVGVLEANLSRIERLEPKP